jgi:hypothetical protein
LALTSRCNRAAWSRGSGDQSRKNSYFMRYLTLSMLASARMGLVVIQFGTSDVLVDVPQFCEGQSFYPGPEKKVIWELC